MSDRERTIADALASPHWVGGVRHLAEILTAYGESGERDFSKLIARLDQRGRGAAFKRLGYLAELLWPGTEALRKRALARRMDGRESGNSGPTPARMYQAKVPRRRRSPGPRG